ncbi:MAG: DUF4238 domain-containing protein [Candidatus Gracilibacteria bacterium]
MTKKKFDHYVPQFLLRGFKMHGTQQGIYCYRRGEEPKPRKIKKIAGMKDFEVLTNGNTELRDKLHDLDNKWGLFLKALEQTTDIASLLNKHGSTFAEFVAFQILRTPIWRNRLCAERNAKNEAKTILQKSKDGYIERLLKGGSSHEEAKREADSAFDLPFRLYLTDNSLRDQDYYIKRVLEEAPNLATALSKRRWAFLSVTRTGDSFITSDAPVLTHVTKQFQFDLLQTAATAVIYMPINKYMAALSAPSIFDRHIKVGTQTEGVELLNDLMIHNAYLEIYSHQKNEKIRYAFDKTSQEDIETFKWGWISENEKQFRNVEGFNDN